MQATEFLAALGKGRITAQTFPDRDGGKPYPQILHGPHKVLERKLRALNEAGAGVFVMVNHGDLQGRRASNVTGIAAYFADLDGAPMPGSWPLPPTVVVESSPGRYHVYWRVTDAPLEQFERVQKHIALLLDGDEKVHDLPRVMRLPGYVHQKAEAFTTRILDLEPEAVYQHAEIVEAFGVPRAPRPLPPACREYIARHQKARAAKQGFRDDSSPGIDRALEKITSAPQGNRNHTLFRIASAVANDIKRGAIKRPEAEEQLLTAALQTGLGEHEARRTIHSALRYAT
jgi:hypothetical protein